MSLTYTHTHYLSRTYTRTHTHTLSHTNNHVQIHTGVQKSDAKCQWKVDQAVGYCESQPSVSTGALEGDGELGDGELTQTAPMSTS